MSDRGVFAIDRGAFDHPIFADEPYTEREAWFWLIGQCAWEPKRIRVGSAVVDLDRGQCAFSLRFMATKWKWSEPRVRRFLNRLKTDAMLLVSTTQKVTQITICNYNKYAFGRRSDVSEIDARSDAAATQQRRKEEEPKKDNNKEEKKEPSLRSDDWPADYREQFWNAYPNKVGKAYAIKKLDGVRKRGVVPWRELAAGLQRYIEKTDDRAWCNPATWISQQRWSDEPAANPARAGPHRIGGGMAKVAAELRRQAHEHADSSAEPEFFGPGQDFGTVPDFRQS